MNAWSWKQVLKHEGEPVLLLTIRRPDPPDTGRSLRRIGAYYRRLGEVWKSRWEQNLFPLACAALDEARAHSRPFQPWTASLDFAVTLEEPTRLSIRLEAVEHAFPALPSRVWSADVWDVRTGGPIPLKRVLPQGLTRRALTDRLAAQAAQRLASGESLLYQDVEYRARVAFSPDRFFLTPEGPVVFYPLQSLGPPAEGIPAFLLDPESLLVKKKSKKRC